MKRFGSNEGAAYPDLGCNNELYTAADFLEIETLGSVEQLLPGGCADHVERWYLFPAIVPGSSEERLTEELLRLVDQAPGIEGQRP